MIFASRTLISSCLAALCTGLSVGGGTLAQAAEDPPWWDPGWQSRLVITTVEPKLVGKINTARVTIDAQPQLHKGGQDIRVIDDQLRPVPHLVVPLKDGAVAVDFSVENATSDRYCLYFNSPNAPAVQHKWVKRVGGLELETRPLVGKYRRNAASLAHMQQIIANCTQPYGKKPWPRISDTHNPFSADEDNYLSIYTGDIFCPETGPYRFATDSDDSSFLLINDSLVAQWPGGHVPAQTWEHHGSVALKRGIHKITYYHVETWGGQLARAGWKKPSDDHFSVIPAKAFVRELPTWIMARQERAKPLNTYFTFEPLGALRLGSDEHIFPAFRFTSRATAALGKIASHYWEFGDGSSSAQANPTHEYAGEGTHQVKLTVRDRLGFEDSVTRTVVAGAEDIRNVVLFFDLQKSATILEPDDPLDVTLRFRSQIGPIRFDLRSSLRSISGRLIEDTAESMELKAGEWHTVRRRYHPGSTQHSCLLHLSYAGEPIRAQTIDIVPTRCPYGALRVDNEHLVSRDDRIVVLRLDDAPLRRGDRGRRFEVTDRPLRLMTIDDSLSPAAEAETVSRTYYGKLKGLIQEAHPDVQVDLKRVGRYDKSSGYLPLVRLSRLSEDVVAFEPDVVLLVCSITDILHYMPVHDYAAFLKATLDQILSQTKADVFLVTPPPQAVNQEISKPYAMAAKQVAQQRKVPSVDLYSLFLLREPDVQSFYRDEIDPDPVIYLEPNSKGQQLIAREIYRIMYGSRPKYGTK